eukprot:TRINITY_DN4642_c0_g1_i7.p1 TRINITY_DN4642_c0_g1~~TRINITY_DN4642_c0_g1_i7.p1  ORF type:complete len:243 (+),score=42.21 TRINITY_DN4642_c0_g1_i7:388-1116(+)
MHRTTTDEPVLFDLPPNSLKYCSVAGQFKDSWRHKDKSQPTITRIFLIRNSSRLDQRYLSYQEQVAATHPHCYKGAGRGNEVRRWHGPGGVKCTGITNGTVCTDPSCCICNIIRKGFSVSYSGTRKATKQVTNTTFQRYGKGLYFTSTSSKSHDYASSVAQVLSGLHCQFLCAIVVGKAQIMTADDETMCAAKLTDGCHSIVAPGRVDDPLKGATVLNHDEVVVYRDDAVRNRCLVFYRYGS